MSNIYHQELLDDPTIMLSMGIQTPITQTNPLTSLDGVVGGISGDYPFVITSPNADFIPVPFLGNTQTVYMRADYRYGSEDHIQWPQTFLSEYGHHICIERRCDDGPLAGLWLTPSKEQDFEIDPNIAHGIGLLTTRFFTQVQMAVQDACDEHASYDAPTDNPLLNRYRAVLTHFEMNLQHTRLPFLRAFLILRLYQRTALELRAYQWYMKDVWPILADKVKLPARPLPLKTQWMGAFTFNSGVANKLFFIGCPVWVIREAKLGRSFRCFKVVPLQWPVEHDIVLHEHERTYGRFPPIFNGSPLSRDKYHRMHMWTSNHVVNFENPYARSLTLAPRPTGPLPPPSSSSRPVQVGPQRKGNKGASAPYKKANVFRQSYHRFLPVPVPSWVRALESTEDDTKICKVDAPSGYFVPRPEIFVAGENDEKRGLYIRSWLRLRPVVLSLYEGPDVVPVWQRLVVSHQAWRTWLLEGRLDVDPVRANPKSAAGKKEGRFRDEIAAKVAELRAGDPDVDIIPSSVTPRWHEEVMDNALSDHLEACREILWDVGEMGFRLDLMYLDSKVSEWGATPEHHHLLQCCFRSGDQMLTRIDLGMANTGLAELDWMTRAPFVWSLKQLMMKWTESIPSSVGAPCPDKGYNMDEFLELELNVAQHYINTFFINFRRLPALPLQLSHLPKPSRIHFSPPEVEQRPPVIPGHWKPILSSVN